MRKAIFLAAGAATLSLAACNQHQSTLSPFGEQADQVRSIAIVLVVGSVILAAGLALLMRHAMRAPEGQLTHKGGMKLVLWLGGIGPSILLLGLLVYALPAMRPIPVANADLRIGVDGEQFWWRVRYAPPGGSVVDAANELRLPVGRTVELSLRSPDVIHSFWVPGLAGKMDMIPGRTNRLVVRATKAGTYRGVCAEFCGLGHALMAFDVVAMEPAAFERWLAAQARPATPTASPGARLFASYGCSGCHSVRGIGPVARIGPDLTHFGSRPTLAAGILPMTHTNIAGFVRDPGKTKPGVRMPAFPQMSAAEADQIASYLQGLK
ncbi:cytochrome c oxidase subunit II [Sphingomonas sp. Leaf20]|uniref:cytochrome c oxidase subunit II n=1 Tax=Sphingomonas sp. Leaf20 TaxID=1735685 RepID=UPI0006F7A032|nr:cytochrome c oxidase subunit II [Sphingomonas sp. Leaf20]KQM71008.1 cytochrome B [Sphingomonas sp. Leaf20]